MKAVVYTEYGTPEVLHVAEVTTPMPKENEVLVRVHAVPVNFGDLLARNFKSVTAKTFSMPGLFLLPAKLAFGINKPKIRVLGSEFAGVVESVGSGVTQFKPGDKVFGYRGERMGAYAEYVCIAADGMVAKMPSNMTFEEAAAVPYGAYTALSLLKKVGIQPGQKVLINGASGGIGSYAVQLAKEFGAQVTGVCGAPRMAFVKSLGADKVIDYRKFDFTQSGERYDLIVDIQGKRSFAECKRVLNPNGRVLYVSFKMKQLLQMLWTQRFGSQKVICALSSEHQADLVYIRDLIEAGKIKSVIDRCFPMEQTADAHRYAESGSKQGHVVVRFA
ncbi:MAG: NAD(P)-dependent alcohol dehydrogenase [Anaerolineae bacterium]